MESRQALSTATSNLSSENASRVRSKDFPEFRRIVQTAGDESIDKEVSGPVFLFVLYYRPTNSLKSALLPLNSAVQPLNSTLLPLNGVRKKQ